MAIDGTPGNDTLVGTTGDDTIRGFGGNDFLNGGFGFDLINGGRGVDTVSYTFFGGIVDADLKTGVVAFPGNSLLTDTLLSIENIITGAGNDLVRGTLGGNLLNTGSGNDYLLGRRGADILIGGAGEDVFDFNAASESNAAARDLIRSGVGSLAFDGAGVVGGDVIDLTGIDAKANVAGDQAFTFGGTGIGRVSLVNNGNNTLLRANLDSDANFEFQVVIRDGAVLASAYTAGDFLL